MPGPKRKSDLDILRYAGLGTQLALTMALFAWGGHALDGWLDTSPWLLIVGCFAGMTVGMYVVVRDVGKLSKREGRARTEGSDEPS